MLTNFSCSFSLFQSCHLLSVTYVMHPYTEFMFNLFLTQMIHKYKVSIHINLPNRLIT